MHVSLTAIANAQLVPRKGGTGTREIAALGGEDGEETQEMIRLAPKVVQPAGGKPLLPCGADGQSAAAWEALREQGTDDAQSQPSCESVASEGLRLEAPGDPDSFVGFVEVSVVSDNRYHL